MASPRRSSVRPSLPAESSPARRRRWREPPPARRSRRCSPSATTSCRCRPGRMVSPAISRLGPSELGSANPRAGRHDDGQARLHATSGRAFFEDDAGMRLLVCGGAGFIGSTFARTRLLELGDEVTVLDKLTYAGREENFRDFAGHPNFQFVRGAIEDPVAVAAAIEVRPPEAIVNFAAETHVDRSIAAPDAFVSTHALGTYVLLEAARAHGLRYVQVSTDEVYGSVEVGSFSEESPLAPSSPYSATKAGADLLVQSYFHTYELPAVICRGSNNYGPHQHPEKLIPLMVLNAIHGDSLPVYGDGMQVRNWIHSTDFAAAIGHVLEHGHAGEVYNAGGPDEEANMTVVTRILELTGASQSQI